MIMTQLTNAEMLADEVAQLPALRARLAERVAVGDRGWARDVAAVIAAIELRAYGHLTVACTCGWVSPGAALPEDLDPTDPMDLIDARMGVYVRLHGGLGTAAHHML
jgi:hypothetical protein